MANVRSCSVPTQSIIISYLWPTCGWVLLHLGLRWFSLYSPNKGMTSFSCINLKISRQNIKYFYSTKNILSHGELQLLVRRNQKTSHSLFIAVHKVWRGDHTRVVSEIRDTDEDWRQCYKELWTAYWVLGQYWFLATQSLCYKPDSVRSRSCFSSRLRM